VARTQRDPYLLGGGGDCCDFEYHFCSLCSGIPLCGILCLILLLKSVFCEGICNLIVVGISQSV
jgi:hypothetical protein